MTILKTFWACSNFEAKPKLLSTLKAFLSILKWFWVYIKNWACLKKLSMLKPNFEKADGLGISDSFCGDQN